MPRHIAVDVTRPNLSARTVETAVVALAWAALTANAAGVVWQYGSRMPYYDDWYVLSDFATSRRGDWTWLFVHHNAHILPLERLAIAASWIWTDGNLRPLLLSSVAVLSVAAAICLLTLNRLRGATRIEDAIVPLALLGSHAYSDAMWAIMWTNILAAGVLCAITCAIVLTCDRPRPWPFAAILFSVAFLAYQGGPGLLYSIGLAPALTFLGWRILRGSPSRGTLVVVIVASLLTAIAVGIVLFYEASIVVSGEAGMGTRRRVGVAFLHMLSHAFGRLAQSNLAIFSTLMPLFLVTAAGFGLGTRNRHDPKAVASLIVILPVLVLCAAIAVSRTGGSGGFTTRYVGMVMPVWCSLALASVTIDSGGVLGAILRLASLMLAISTGMALHSHVTDSEGRLAADRRIDSDIAAGHSAERLAADLSASYLVFPPERFADQLLAIQSLGAGSLAKISTSGEYAWREIPAVPDQTRGCEAEGDSWLHVDGSRMHFPSGDEEVGDDAIKITFECQDVPWAVSVAGGAPSPPDECVLGPDLISRKLYPVAQAASGKGHRYTTTFAFDAAAGGFVFAPPTGSGRIRILSLEAGRRNRSTVEPVRHTDP